MANSTSFQSQFLEAIAELGATKNLTSDQIVEILSSSIKKALAKEDPDIRVEVTVDLNTGLLKIDRLLKIVPEETDDFDDINEITLAEAQKTMPEAKIGDDFLKEISLINKNDISKQMVQYILQLFKQKIAELTNKSVVAEWLPRVGHAIYAEVEKRDDRHGSYIINLESTSGYLQKSETISGETLLPGKKYWFVIKAAKEQSRGWPIILSRSDEGLLRHLLISNIPELEDGTIEIKAIARAAGQKSKVAVISHKPDFDPVGAIVGRSGDKIKFVSSQIRNELIDVLIWSDDYKQLVVNAIHPVPVLGINIVEESEREKSMEVFVDDQYLPTVIGRGGINIKLLAKLIGWSIDVKSVSQASEEDIVITPINYKPQGNAQALERTKSRIYNNSNRPNFASGRSSANNSNSNTKSESNLSPIDVMSFSTKTTDLDEITVDIEPEIEEEIQEPEVDNYESTLNKVELDNFVESNHELSIEQTSVDSHEASPEIASKSNGPSDKEIMTNLINNIDLSEAPKRQVKELKVQQADHKKKESKSKKKNQRKIIDDFSLLDSDIKDNES